MSPLLIALLILAVAAMFFGYYGVAILCALVLVIVAVVELLR